MQCVRGAQQLENMKNDNNHQNCIARNTKRMCNKQATQPDVRLTRQEKDNFKVDEKNNKQPLERKRHNGNGKIHR